MSAPPAPRPTLPHASLYPVALLAIVIVAAALRAYGIDWGLPNDAHPTYSYDPDESPMMEWARWLVQGQLIPKHFIYGGTFYYTVLNSFHHLGALLGPWLGGDNALADAILAGRWFLVGAALLTLLMLYVAGSHLYGRATGLLAALFLAVCPAHVMWAQRVRPDELAALMVVLLLLLAAKVLRAEDGAVRRQMLLAGAALGVAVALRFPLAAFGLLPALAFVLRPGRPFGAAVVALLRGPIWLLGVAAFVAYAVASPHSLLYPESLLAGLKVTWAYESSPFPDSIGAGPGVYRFGYTLLGQALGTPMYALVLAAVAWLVVRRRREDVLLLAGVVPYAIAGTLVTWMVVRYTLPILPLLALAAAAMVVDVARRWPRWRVPLGVAIAGVVAWTTLGTLAFLRLEANTNVREVATAWIDRNVPSGTMVATVRHYLAEEFFNPTIPKDRVNAVLLLEDRSEPRALLASRRLEYVVLSEMTYASMDRLGDDHPTPIVRELRQGLIDGGYEVVQEFKQPTTMLGIDFADRFSAHDYLVVNPGIRIYRPAPR